MCWSWQASLVGFILGTVLSIILIIRNKPWDRYWGFLFLFIISMQFLEFLIWLDQPLSGKDCTTGKYEGKLNNIASQVASVQNFLQPTVAILLTVLLIPKKDTLSNSQTVNILGFIISITSVIVWIFSKKLYKTTLCTIPCNGCNNHHLKWQWADSRITPFNTGHSIWWVYKITTVLFLLNLCKTMGGLILGITILIAFIGASTIYPFNQAVGSWWCVSAVGAPLLKLLLPTDMMNKKTF